MKLKTIIRLFFVLTVTISTDCYSQTALQPLIKTPFVWENATIYSINGASDTNKKFAQISKQIDEGFFDRLGITAISLSNVFEQINGADKTGNSDFNRTFDWTSVDKGFGTEKELAELISKAHKNGIRVLLNAQLNHVGASSLGLSPWPDEWVRTQPICDFKSFATTTACAINKSLSDIRTESTTPVSIPAFLGDKWRSEGRLERETKELDAFFKMTGYPRAPRFFIIKWVTDYIREFGIDGYIIDNVENVETQVWGELKSQCNMAFADWKQQNRDKVIDDKEFYMIGNVRDLGINKPKFDFGDQKVNYYESGFNNLFNADFSTDAEKGYEFVFANYSSKLNNELEGLSISNYFPDQTMYQRATKYDRNTILLLSPGIAIVDAQNYGSDSAKETASHLEKLTNFRKNHPAVGAGIHRDISTAPYVFSRGYSSGRFSDRVIIGLDLAPGRKELQMASLFKNNTVMRDAYSGKEAIVKSGRLVIDTPFTIVLLEEK